MAISTLSEFREYIKNRLGGGSAGVINVEMSVDQLNQSIEDAVQIFQRYAYGEGLYEDWLVLSLVPGVSAYSTSGANIEDVVDFSISTASNNSINQLFTPANIVLGGSFQVFNGGAGMALANYQTAMMYLKNVEEIFSIKFRVDYRELQQMVIVTPTPTMNLFGLMKVYRKEAAINMYNHPSVKKLAVAYSKQVWGNILSKYGSIALPGGGSYGEFGNTMIEKGEAEVEKIEQKMKDESEKFGFMIG